jgi:acyl-CoA thioesterase
MTPGLAGGQEGVDRHPPVAGTPPSFAEVTAVEAVVGAPGRFRAHLPPSWSTPGGVHGGVLVAAGLRAALAGVDRPDLALRTAHAVFLSPPEHDLAFDVHVLRQGAGSAHVRVTGTCARRDRPALDLTVVLTADRESPAFVEATPPDVRSWRDAVSGSATDGLVVAGAPVAPPLFDNLDVRPVLGEMPWSETWTPDQPARHVRWNRYRRPPSRDRAGHLDPLALVPLADLPGPAVWVKLAPGDPVLFFLSLDLSITFLEPVTDEWVLTDIEARWMGAGHVHVETDLWSAGRLVATSTQTMLRRLPPR